MMHEHRYPERKRTTSADTLEDSIYDAPCVNPTDRRLGSCVGLLFLTLVDH
jgi:hypothetical protein